MDKQTGWLLEKQVQIHMGPKGAGLTMVSRETGYPLFHEKLHTVSET